MACTNHVFGYTRHFTQYKDEKDAWEKLLIQSSIILREKLQYFDFIPLH